MPDISSDRETAVLDLDNSLSEDGGADMFSLKNAMHVMSSVKLKDHVRGMVSPSAFLESDRINEDAFQKCVNRPAITMWFATARDLLDRAVSQVEGTILLEMR